MVDDAFGIFHFSFGTALHAVRLHIITALLEIGLFDFDFPFTFGHF